MAAEGGQNNTLTAPPRLLGKTGTGKKGNAHSCRGRGDTAGEDDDITTRKAGRRRWWRRFSPSIVCHRKQRGRCRHRKESAGGRRFHLRAWPKSQRFRTSADGRQTDCGGDEPSTTFGSKMRNVFYRSSVSLQKTWRTQRSVRGRSTCGSGSHACWTPCDRLV